jgi:antitoxin component YwqK of YwqJK toxin-antitoxin module
MVRFLVTLVLLITSNLCNFVVAKDIHNEDKAFKKLAKKAYKKDIHNGHFIEDNGEQVSSDINLKNDELESISKIYLKDGSIKESASFKAGKLNGLFLKKDKKGNKEFECNFLNGALNGNCNRFYKNAILESSTTYANDITQGPFKKFHKDGRIMKSGSYYQGNLNGNYKEYATNGQLVKDLTYKNNVLSGMAKTYFPNGRPRFVGSFTEGVLHGFTKSYNENGVLVENREYKNGNPVYTPAELEMMKVQAARQAAAAAIYSSFNQAYQTAQTNNLLRQQNYLQSLNLYNNSRPRNYSGTIQPDYIGGYRVNINGY